MDPYKPAAASPTDLGKTPPTGDGGKTPGGFDYRQYNAPINEIYGAHPNGMPAGWDWAEWARQNNWMGGKDPTRYGPDGADTYAPFGGAPPPYAGTPAGGPTTAVTPPPATTPPPKVPAPPPVIPIVPPTPVTHGPSTSNPVTPPGNTPNSTFPTGGDPAPSGGGDGLSQYKGSDLSLPSGPVTYPGAGAFNVANVSPVYAPGATPAVDGAGAVTNALMRRFKPRDWYV